VAKGYLALVLHAHLPFIRHPESENYLEENWLFEAITDTYVPMIEVFDGLIQDNVDFHVTFSLSPTLMTMLRDELLISRYLRHLDRLIHLSEKETERVKNEKRFHDLAVMYRDRFIRAKKVFSEIYGKDILLAFKKFNDLGKLEVITCCGTHGYLPSIDPYKAGIRAQIKTAVDTYKNVFGSVPKGMWLPECGYNEGHEKILREFGIQYFFVEAHGVLFGSPRPKYAVYSPYICESGTYVFGRDLDSSKSVWSAKDGYPGNYNYREYYRDIGFDLDFNYIKPYINNFNTRVNTGIKYYRITGATDQKDIYDHRLALETAAKDSADFMNSRQKQLDNLVDLMDRTPVIVSPYDAELFGHWWFEGPDWLNYLLRKMHFDQDKIKTITPGGYLKLYDKYPPIKPSMSSWGYKGYSEVWLDGSNDWIYRHLHKISELMSESAKQYTAPSQVEERALNQMARELLLAQSSDWAFIMKTGTFVNYAKDRTKEHIGRFLVLHDQLRKGEIQETFLKESEGKYNIFPDIDYRIYARID